MVPWTHILIGSAVFARHIRMTNTQTHGPSYMHHCGSRSHLLYSVQMM